MKLTGANYCNEIRIFRFQKSIHIVIRAIVRERIGWQGGLGKPAGPAASPAFESLYMIDPLIDFNDPALTAAKIRTALALTRIRKADGIGKPGATSRLIPHTGAASAILFCWVKARQAPGIGSMPPRSGYGMQARRSRSILPILPGSGAWSWDPG